MCSKNLPNCLKLLILNILVKQNKHLCCEDVAMPSCDIYIDVVVREHFIGK